MTAPDNKKAAEEKSLFEREMENPKFKREYDRQKPAFDLEVRMLEISDLKKHRVSAMNSIASFILANYVSKQDFERYAAHDTGCPREMRGHDDGQCDCVCDCGLSKLKSGGAGR